MALNSSCGFEKLAQNCPDLPNFLRHLFALLRAFAVFGLAAIFSAETGAIAVASTVGNSEPSISSPTFSSELASPWTTKARPWVLGGLGGTAILLLLEDQVGDPTQEDVAEDKPLGTLSKVGDYGGQMLPNILYSVGMLTHWYATKNQVSFDRSITMLKASLYSISITSGLKLAVREPRPGDRYDTKSFPSGHSTAAFSFASYVATEHELGYGVVAITLATLVAASRVNDNRHYLHDVVAGATIGSAYGIGLSLLHRGSRIRTARNTGSSQFHVVPVFDLSLRGIALVSEF